MSTNARRQQDQAVKLIDKLMKISPDQGALLRAMQIRERLMLPMKTVLERVPGETIVDKAAACGVSRQNFYNWLRGISRPNPKQAKLLSDMTGYKTDDIRGKTKLSRQTVSGVAAMARRRPARPTRSVKRQSASVTE
jgi:hypothetical protein